MAKPHRVLTDAALVKSWAGGVFGQGTEIFSPEEMADVNVTINTSRVLVVSDGGFETLNSVYTVYRWIEKPTEEIKQLVAAWKEVNDLESSKG